MTTRIQRSINKPLRDRQMEFDTRWNGPDKGLILCWEKGRKLSATDPELAEKAKKGELIVLVWKGGVEKKLKGKATKLGTWSYYATWQGLRGEDLDITREEELTLTCTRTGQEVLFSSRSPVDEEEQTEDE